MEDFKETKRKRMIKNGWYVTMEHAENNKISEPKNWSYLDYMRQYNNASQKKGESDGSK